MKIGVLALQGAFIEHINKLRSLDTECFEIRKLADLDTEMDGLILPGGESTVMCKLLRELELFNPLHRMITGGLPVLGTCAGLLLLANSIENRGVLGFATMDIQARRNAYGRQLGSFYAEQPFASFDSVPMTFIRAPYIESVGDKAEILAAVDKRIVAARQDNQLVTAFHPELTEDSTVHRYFLSLV